MSVELLNPSEGERWRNIRLASLHDAPDAFGSTLADAERHPDVYWSGQVKDIPTWIAVLEGRDAGVVRGVESTEDTDEAYLISMWVAPGARGKTVGSSLIDAVIRWSGSRGFLRLVLDVADYNSPAIALYTRKGFVATGETGTLPAPRQHITEHRMALNLTKFGLEEETRRR